MSDTEPPEPPDATPPATPKPPALHLVPAPPKRKPPKKQRQAKSPAKTEPVAQPAQQDSKPSAVKCAPDAQRCNMLITQKDGQKARCTRYTVKTADGGRSRYCIGHDNTPSSQEKMEQAGRKGGKATQEPNDPRYAELSLPVGRRALLTQDDISAERQRIMYQLATGKIPASAGNALLAGLQQASTHIEQFGGKQGVEGGAGYLRLMPGVKLIEQLDDKNRPLTSEEMKLIYERQDMDVKKGKRPPKTWQECILLYLGMAREPEVAYNERQEPVGEYRCEMVKDAVTGEKSVIRIFVRYRSREMTQKRLASDAEAAQRLREK